MCWQRERELELEVPARFQGQSEYELTHKHIHADSMPVVKGRGGQKVFNLAPVFRVVNENDWKEWNEKLNNDYIHYEIA